MLLPLHVTLAASLVGPFCFEPITIDNRARQRVHTTYWYLLVGACSMLGILPPTIQIKHKWLLPPVIQKGARKRKRDIKNEIL